MPDEEPIDPWLGRRLGNYRLERVLGRGGMASVYEAHHVALGTRHALKVLEPVFARHPDVRARFLREGRVQAQFRHAGIARVTDTITGPATALVMEYLRGESLRSLLARGTVSVEVAALLIEDIADALAYAHSLGVVHRDIKPDNIFLAEDDDDGLRAVLLDFGIARVDEMTELTQSGVMMGTPRYMSPEQMDDPRSVDGRTDVFSLAVVLFELLAGVSPHPGATPRAVTLAVLSGRFHTISKVAAVPRTLDAVMERAFAPDREDRFGDVRQFAAAVVDALAAPAPAPVAVHPMADVRPAPPAVSASSVGMPATTWPPVPEAEVAQLLAQRAAGEEVVRCRRCGTRGVVSLRRCRGCGAPLNG